MEITLDQLVIGYWSLVILFYLLRFTNDLFYQFTSYGKVDEFKYPFFGVSQKFHWIFIYTFASVFNLYLFTYQSSILTIIYQSHLFRRLYESLFITKFSNLKTVRFPLFIFGVSFYLFSCLTIFLQSKTIQFNILTILFFSYGNLMQYQSHTFLASLRRENDKKYHLPKGGWFEYITCPHYLAEILIYFSLFLSSMTLTNGLLLFFVILNLISSACDTYDWYCDKFPDFPKERRILIPYLF